MELKTYRNVLDKNNGAGILCRFCELTSFSPNDIRSKYCGNCNIFHDDFSQVLTRAVAGNLPKDWAQLWPMVAVYFSGVYHKGGQLSPLWEVSRRMLLDLPPPHRPI